MEKKNLLSQPDFIALHSKTQRARRVLLQRADKYQKAVPDTEGSRRTHKSKRSGETGHAVAISVSTLLINHRLKPCLN